MDEHLVEKGLGSSFLLEKIFQRKLELQEMRRDVNVPREVIETESDYSSPEQNEPRQDHGRPSKQESTPRILDPSTKNHGISMIRASDEGDDASGN